MRNKLVSANNEEANIDCIGCSLVKGEITVIGGLTFETEHFTLAQDWEIPIPGFFIIGSKRHFRDFSQLTESESAELVILLIKVRRAMKDVLKIDDVTVIQEDKSLTSHFHIWLFPWHSWMKEFGYGLKSVRDIMENARKNLKTDENLDNIKTDVKNVKKYLKSIP